MPQIRFSTARSLLEAFPELSKKLTVAATDEAPLDFLRKLSAQAKFEDGVTFCAHLLPRREAVWWACGAVKASSNDAAQAQSDGFLAAQKWVYDPSEENRLAALETGNKSDKAKPATWLALGAGWSGGMLSSHPKAPVPMPHYLTARAAHIAILLNAQPIGAAERAGSLQACITEGIKLAKTGL
jgi:hypothetical protein